MDSTRSDAPNCPVTGSEPEEVREDLRELLERHARLLAAHAEAFEELRRSVEEIRGSLSVLADAQRQMNLSMSGIRTMWDRLECNQPRKRPPSAELRAVAGEEKP